MVTLVAVLATFVGLIGIVMNKLWDPIADCLGYPFQVGRHVKDLGIEATKLQKMRDDFQRLDPRPSSDQRKGWVSRVQDLLDMNEDTQSRYGRRRPLVNYLRFCDIGVQATRELEKAKGLATEGQDLVREARAKPSPNPDPSVKPHHDVLLGMGCYKTKVLDFIMDTDPRSQTLAIWGMGGVGKSSLLKLVHDSPSELVCGNDPFDHVLYVQAGKECTIRSIQDDITTSLQLPSVHGETYQKHVICNHLQKKSFLLLLDDLWDRVDLQDLGIPMPLGTTPTGNFRVIDQQGNARTAVRLHRRRKLVLATRSWDVCCRMGCRENTIRINFLAKQDAWSLFARVVGKSTVNDEGIPNLATKMVEECGGLPLALCTIGEAMSGKTDASAWRSAIDLFKKSKLRKIPNGTEELFKILKRSYDHMEDTLKKCFLICSLWPEDENISREKLIGWWMGLGLVDVSNQGVDNGHSIISCLVGQSMLEKGDAGLNSSESSHVKMHKVTRRMALSIVNDRGEKESWLPQSFCRTTLPEEKWCSVEKAWTTLPADTLKWSLEICFPQLIMLVIRHGSALEPTHCLQEITFLDLQGMKRGKFPSEICRLTKLQHLNLSATEIDELPPELEALQNLKCLNIRDNGGLKTIPQGLILQLQRLKELDLFCTGSGFPRVDYISGVLTELASTKRQLPMLGFTVQTGQHIQQLGGLGDVSTQALCMNRFKDGSHQDVIDLQLLSNLKKLRELTIVKSSQKELVAENVPANGPDGLLHLLEVFKLITLLQLEKVTVQEPALLSIRVIDIYRCNKLRDAVWIRHLKCLQQLTVANCEQMERLFDSAESPSGADFPKLERLYLEELPQLSNICSGACKFEKLSYVCVTRCQRMERLFGSAESPSGADFPKLERLYLEELPQLSNICSGACKFEKLSYVRVTRCQRMERLFGSAESPSGADFPKLERLYLEELPQLSNICSGACKFEKLSYVRVTRCQRMERLFGSAESPSGADFPKLESLYLEELPQLSNICSGACKFEKLSYVRVTRCQRLNAILVDEHRVNKKKIRIDCNEDWWTTLALEQSQVDIWSATFCF